MTTAELKFRIRQANRPLCQRCRRRYAAPLWVHCSACGQELRAAQAVKRKPGRPRKVAPATYRYYARIKAMLEKEDADVK